MNLMPYRFALITGASSGIGEEFARQVAALKIYVVLVARSMDKLNSLAKELSAQDIQAIPIECDLTQEDSIRALHREIENRGIGIDLLINNAGFGSYGDFSQSDWPNQSKMIDLNIRALVHLTNLFLPPMISKKHGAIVNISSLAGFQPVPYMSVYGATKAFVTSFSMALAAESRESGVRVISVCPGRTKTNFQVVSHSNRIRIRSHNATARDVVRDALLALVRNRVFTIQGARNKTMYHIQRFFPKAWVLRVAHKVFKPKENI